ncbi:DUF2750 domain-containing protein [Mucilaginibacter mali]|uniref:DUF2750 domain-containing protein n=1 Tax=Mucilaginibacter mali TaxID=2740462 RepID=A0A7D4TYC7_9SPHI|nr:DUF2750 domain-containing protein [Mucilaginibacter mali]
MNSSKVQNILNMRPEERYHYFIRKIGDFEEVWGLYDNGWATSKDNLGNIVLPFWPEQGFAELCVAGTWKSYIPKSISLSDFMDKWLHGMDKDGTLVGVFPIPDGKGIVLSASKIRSDIENELDQY